MTNSLIIMYIVYSLLEHYKDFILGLETTCESKHVMRQYYWEVLVESYSSQDKNGSSEPGCFES